MVRQDSHTDLAADGDYMIPTINANGEIRVTSSSSGGATEAKQDDIESSLNSLIAANHTDLVALETTLTAILIQVISQHPPQQLQQMQQLLKFYSQQQIPIMLRMKFYLLGLTKN